MTDQARRGEAAPRAPLSSSSMRLPVRVRTQAEFVLAKFCCEQIAPAVADQVRLEYEVHGLTAILVERRPPWPSQTPDEEWQRIPIARFRFTVDSAGGLSIGPTATTGGIATNSQVPKRWPACCERWIATLPESSGANR